MQQGLTSLKKYLNIIIIMAALFLAAGSALVLADQNQIQVKANIVNVRNGPGLSYNTMGQIKSGQTLDIIGKRNGWYQIRLDNDKIGWVASWLLNNTEVGLNASDKYGRINVSSVSVYQTPDNNATVLGTLQANQTVNILYESNGWSQIKYQSGVGWVRSTVINATSQDQIAATQTNNANNFVVTTTEANTKLRSTPSTKGKIITQLDEGSTLTYLKTQGNWFEVKTSSGQQGYVANWVAAKTLKSGPIQKPKSLAQATIVLDPGHGGDDSGAISNSGQFERTYTLIVAKLVAQKLREAGANVIMTRDSNTTVSLERRPQIANNANADAFVSFHFDSSDVANDASGVTTYYYDAGKDGALAKAFASQIQNSLPLDDKGTRFGNFQVLRDNQRPAVLLELGYINSDHDFKYIRSPKYQEQIADMVFKTFSNYFS